MTDYDFEGQRKIQEAHAILRQIYPPEPGQFVTYTATTCQVKKNKRYPSAKGYGRTK